MDSEQSTEHFQSAVHWQKSGGIKFFRNNPKNPSIYQCDHYVRYPTLVITKTLPENLFLLIIPVASVTEKQHTHRAEM